MSINFTFFFRLKNMLIQHKCHTHTKKTVYEKNSLHMQPCQKPKYPRFCHHFLFHIRVSSLTHSVRFTYTHHRSLQSIQTEKSHDTPTQPDRQCTFYETRLLRNSRRPRSTMDMCRATKRSLSRAHTCAR